MTPWTPTELRRLAALYNAGRTLAAQRIQLRRIQAQLEADGETISKLARNAAALVVDDGEDGSRRP